jgi:hypothetical protein
MGSCQCRGYLLQSFLLFIIREELRDIFIPQFEKILALINDQVQQVNSRFGPGAMKVLNVTLKVLTFLAYLPCWWTGV